MPFGKFRGFAIADLPDDYITWLLSIELHGHLFDAVFAESRSRQRESARQRGTEPSLLTLKVRPADVPLVREIIDRGYRSLAKLHHPDAGAMDEAEKHVTEALELLDGALGRRPGQKVSVRAVRGYLDEARSAVKNDDSNRAVAALGSALEAIEPKPEGE